MGRRKRVVITGIGPVTSLGVGRGAVLEGLRENRTGLVKHYQPLNGGKWEAFYVHKVPKFDVWQLGVRAVDFEEIVVKQPRSRQVLEDDLKYLLATVGLTLEDSKLSYDPDRNRVGIILTHESPGFDSYNFNVIQEVFSLLQNSVKSRKKWTARAVATYLFDRFAKSVYDMQTFMYLYYVCRTFNLHGYSLFINNACASGLFAIEVASERIRSGHNTAMLVAGADHPLRPFKSLWFKKLGLYAEDGKTKPFDRRRNGFVLGDGGAGLLLEDLDQAVRRGAHIYGEYLGGGFSLDAWKITVPNVGGNFYEAALEEALRNSGVRSKDVDFINPHGVGTRIADQYEARVIQQIFGAKHQQPLISAFKPILGHTLGGSALAETVLALLAMESGLVPPTLNVEEVDPGCDLNLALKPILSKPRVVVKMSSGFAGYNGVAVFKGVDSD